MPVTDCCQRNLNCACASDAVVRPWLHSRAELAKVDFNSSHEEQYHVSYFPFPIWRDESMHDLIVRVAKCAADAVAHSGRPIRMGGHVMVRVDIALTHQGTLVRPFVLYLWSLLHAVHLKPAHKTGMCLEFRVKSARTCWVNSGHHSLYRQLLQQVTHVTVSEAFGETCLVVQECCCDC